MINLSKLDDQNQFTSKGERELLEKDPEEVRSFYALTGPARLEYAKQMAEAEAERIRILRKAQAEGIVEIRRAEAEGLRLVGEALASSPNPELVARLAELIAAEDIAQSLADGRATKLFFPQGAAGVLSLAAALSEALRTDQGTTDEDANLDAGEPSSESEE